MMEFKDFVKRNPSLINFVRSGEATWQNFYEMFTLYGEDNEVWDPYIKNELTNTVPSSFGVGDIMKLIKGIDLENFRKGVEGLSKGIGIIQDLFIKDEVTKSDTYKPRPLYKHFED